MSKKNIIAREKMPDGKIRLTFDAHDGERVYEYGGSSARALKLGRDPGGLSGGKLVEHRKKEK